ncbi:putative JmjC domain-containing protein [Plasmopara halstedii]
MVITKRVRGNQKGEAFDAAETRYVNEYNGFVVPNDNYAIKRIPVSSMTPELFFTNYVCTRTPVVLTGYLEDETFTASEKWTKSNDRLIELIGDTKLTVERRGGLHDKFGKGMAVEMPFCDLLKLMASGDEFHYLTTQDVAFEEDGRPEIMSSFMKKLQLDFPLRPKLMGYLIPQNINMWMGNSKHGSSSGLHHDHHDNLYILMRGKKHFRMYSPSDAFKMYTQGQIANVHPNGLINYVGKETTHYGADPVAERKALAVIERIEAERELLIAEKAMITGELGATILLKAAEERLEAAMFDVLQAEDSQTEVDEECENSASDNEESEAEGDEDDLEELDELALDPEELTNTTAKRDLDQLEGTLPVNFSQVDTQLQGSEHAQRDVDATFPHFKHAKAAFCDLEEGDMLYLPASWFHEVVSYNSAQDNGHLALNYWFHPPDRLTPEHFTSPYSSPFWERDWKQRYQPEKQY